MKIWAILLSTMMTFGVVGCETMEGAGDDIEDAGDAVEDAADDIADDDDELFD